MGQVSYSVSVPEPSRHLAEVEVRMTGLRAVGDSVELAMAAWSPGSYLIRDYARFIRDLEVTAGGVAVTPKKTSKQTWQVPLAGADELVARYRVYGRELTVRTNHIDASHAFLHGPALYIYAPALRDRPHRVRVEAPDGWHLMLALPADGDDRVAADLDELLDSPIHLGEVTVRELEVSAAPARLVLWNDFDGGGVASPDDLARDLATIVDAHTERFGGAPYDDYSFLLMLAPGAYGGLEHSSSSANLNTPYAMASTNDYGDLLELLSHELFHAWNGKRLVPEGLAELDYRAEQYTSCLWVIEGLTSYYDRYTLVRSGTMSVTRYLEKLANEWGRLQWTPGRAHQSLEEASFDAWVKLYQRHESNLNTTVSYYLKGGLVATYLDLEIRRRTAGRGSLEQVVQALWRDYGGTGTPYPEQVQPLFEEAAGIELDDLFDRLIRGRDDPDLPGALTAAGLELRATWDSAQLADGAEPVWLGVTVKTGARVGQVVDGSPAAVAGISPGDELIAVDGRRIKTEGGLRKRLKLRRPGDPAEIALFRTGRLHTRRVELAACPPTRFEIASLADPSESQRAFYSAWLGEDHPCADNVIAGATVGRFL